MVGRLLLPILLLQLLACFMSSASCVINSSSERLLCVLRYFDPPPVGEGRVCSFFCWRRLRRRSLRYRSVIVFPCFQIPPPLCRHNIHIGAKPRGGGGGPRDPHSRLKSSNNHTGGMTIRCKVRIITIM